MAPAYKSRLFNWVYLRPKNWINFKVAYYSFDGNKSATFKSFEKRFQAVFPFTIYCLLKSFTILCEI